MAKQRIVTRAKDTKIVE